jgi:hypothetical protein
MTQISHWTCDFCNPSRLHGHSGHGHAVTYGVIPNGWWEVPGRGPGGGAGHACASCVLKVPVQQEIVRLRDAQTRRLVGDNPPTTEDWQADGEDSATLER